MVSNNAGAQKNRMREARTICYVLLAALGTAVGPPPKPEADSMNQPTNSTRTATAVFAGGCFWCVEAVFEALDGVLDVVSGYAGGSAADANYERVCTGRTKHAEAVQVSYDPARISYEKLLEVFFATHDPTARDRQGPDSGPQYRSAIFYATQQQKQAAEAFIRQLQQSKKYDKPIVTTVEPLEKFYPAEKYHQDFARRNPGHPYVRAWIPAKLQKLRQHFAELLK
jgi:peptide-methionine (S)-S-oxide reductase